MSPRTAKFLAGALALAAVGCISSSSNPCSDDPAVNLAHDDPKCRCNGAIQAEKGQRYDLVPLLIKNLRHPNGDVRIFTGTALRLLTGVDADYRSFASPAEQERAIARWESWWASRSRPDEGDKSSDDGPPGRDGVGAGTEGATAQPVAHSEASGTSPSALPSAPEPGGPPGEHQDGPRGAGPVGSHLEDDTRMKQ